MSKNPEAHLIRNRTTIVGKYSAGPHTSPGTPKHQKLYKNSTLTGNAYPIVLVVLEKGPTPVSTTTGKRKEWKGNKKDVCDITVTFPCLFNRRISL